MRTLHPPQCKIFFHDVENLVLRRRNGSVRIGQKAAIQPKKPTARFMQLHWAHSTPAATVMRASYSHDNTSNRHNTSTKQISLANRIIQRPSVLAALRRIIRSVTSNLNLYDDLLQEALVHLWIQLQLRAGQRWSWYRQDCYFHLKNEMQHGTSVDSPRHRALVDENCAGPDGCEPRDPHAEQNLLSSVSARDIIAELVPLLDTSERVLLPFLAVGCGVREIARHLCLSHTGVIKRRRKIALATRALGISTTK